MIFVCLKCDHPLKYVDLSGDVYSLLMGKQAAYCENESCDRYGLLSMLGKQQVGQPPDAAGKEGA